MIRCDRCETELPDPPGRFWLVSGRFELEIVVTVEGSPGNLCSGCTRGLVALFRDHGGG